MTGAHLDGVADGDGRVRVRGLLFIVREGLVLPDPVAFLGALAIQNNAAPGVQADEPDGAGFAVLRNVQHRRAPVTLTALVRAVELALALQVVVVLEGVALEREAFGERGAFGVDGRRSSRHRAGGCRTNKQRQVRAETTSESAESGKGDVPAGRGGVERF